MEAMTATMICRGPDSSVVSALAAGSLSRRDQAKLATFSVDFAGSADAFEPDLLRPSHDEPYARTAAYAADPRLPGVGAACTGRR